MVDKRGLKFSIFRHMLCFLVYLDIGERIDRKLADRDKIIVCGLG